MVTICWLHGKLSVATLIIFLLFLKSRLQVTFLIPILHFNRKYVLFKNVYLIFNSQDRVLRGIRVENKLTV